MPVNYSPVQPTYSACERRSGSLLEIPQGKSLNVMISHVPDGLSVLAARWSPGRCLSRILLMILEYRAKGSFELYGRFALTAILLRYRHH